MTLSSLIQQVEYLVTAIAPEEQVLAAFGDLVDAADSEGNEAALVRATELAAAVEGVCSGANAALSRYFHANAWSGLYRHRQLPSRAQSWVQPELLNEILQLRSAIQHEGAAEVPPFQRAQFHSNLGNAFSKTGRLIDAIEHWETALELNPALAMARGNLGEGLVIYASLLYDDGHKELMLRRARVHLAFAVEIGLGRDGATYPEALEHFERGLEFVDQVLASAGASPDDDISWIHEFSLGRSKPERNYRRWCLERKLFINPLNDATTAAVTAHDVLGLPSHPAECAGISYLAFFNQLKQEYAYARWCLYEGSTAARVHISDREVKLAFNADHARYSNGLEQVKTAFRAAYSLLDKVAYFVNDYWQLKIDEKQVDFNSVWVDKKRPRVGLIREGLEDSKNLPLQALYWLSRDVFDEKLHMVAAPDAQALKNLRNHLEHKFLKVVDVMPSGHEREELLDRLSHKVTPEELTAKAERVLKMARSALVYLCLAMHRQEELRPDDGIDRFPFQVDDVPDELKR